MQKGSIIQAVRSQVPTSGRFAGLRRTGMAAVSIGRGSSERLNNTPTPTPRAAAGALLAQINASSDHNHACRITVTEICEHFEQKELRSADSFRSFATVKTYRGYIHKWVKPRWGSIHLDEIKAVEVEGWLRRLPIARSSRAKIRNIMSVLFNHACRYELFDRNPMRFVRQGVQRDAKLQLC